MEMFLEALAKMDFVTIIILLGGVYLMNRNTVSHFDSKFDKLQETVTDIDRRLCRLEGAFASKDCCMIKDSSLNKKIVE